MEARPGATAEVGTIVTADRTAEVLGNSGVTVLATRSSSACSSRPPSR